MCQYATTDAFKALRPVGPGRALHYCSHPSDCMPRERMAIVGKSKAATSAQQQYGGHVNARL